MRYPESNWKCMKEGEKEVKKYRYGSCSERDDHRIYERKRIFHGRVLVKDIHTSL